MAALADDSLYLILNGDGRAELYAYTRDSGEAHDLSQDAAYCGAVRERLQRLRTQSEFARRAPIVASCVPVPASAKVSP